MKKLTLICLASMLVAVLAGCAGKNEDECIRCVGCFNSWTECESSWNNSEITWEEHRDQKIAESQYSTDQCQLVAE